MRLLYSLIWLALLPFAFLYLLWRARRQPEYLRHWRERLGWVGRLEGRSAIWVHAVSVGETRAAAPLIRALRARHPERPLLLTHATPTGRATGRELFGDDVVQAYLPYDFPLCVQLFLARVRPSVGVILETEVWPNLYAACARRRLPLYLVNARLSERSARGYRRFAGLTRPTLARLSGIAAQTGADAERLVALGARNVVVTGNLKFDVTPPADVEARATALRALFGGRFVLLAASTREGEENLLLDALDGLVDTDSLLVLVPRHPQRFDEVARLLAGRGLTFARRGEGRVVASGERVFLGDSMGELAAYYRAADLAIIGGSLLPFGGQNLIEAADAGCPALIGPHTWNFAEAAERAVAEGAARRVADVDALVAEAAVLRADHAARAAMTAAGLRFTATNRGATARILDLVDPVAG